MFPQDSKERKRAADLVISKLLEGSINSKQELETSKRVASREIGISGFLRNSEILARMKERDIFLTTLKSQSLFTILRKRPVRTISGISIVAVMVESHECPGKCIFCPTVDGIPKSYTGKEPAALRGQQNQFNPYNQVKARLAQLDAIGHLTDKTHLIVMGGTFLATSQDYQSWYIKECLDAISERSSRSLEEAIRHAEKSRLRNVGITFETRPDYCKEKHVDRMLSLGGTWVEIGVQTLSDTILQKVGRGHSLQDAIDAIRVARDSGLKVTLHLMPNLFNSPDQDVEMFHKLYENPLFQPDAVKIYPTLVLEGTPLYEKWIKGDYVPYSEDQMVEVIAKIKMITPPYVRIQRVQRDIPAYLIQDGVKHGNLRELARAKLAQMGGKCDCIRCREVGHKWIQQKEIDYDSFSLMVRKYEASEGEEIFLSFETPNQDTIAGFVRLRLPSNNAHRPELLNKATMFVRELHVYGRLVGFEPDNKNAEAAFQHRGLGKKLMLEAEKIVKEEYGSQQILVTSGIGVREYYQSLGYHQIGPYQGKDL